MLYKESRLTKKKKKILKGLNIICDYAKKKEDEKKEGFIYVNCSKQR